jgi:MFS family permease
LLDWRNGQPREEVLAMSGTPRQARSAVTAVFLLNGFVFGSWASRIPAIRDRVGLSDGELGLALACGAIGSIVAMPYAGGRAARIGSRRATRVALGLLCLAAGLVALAPSLPVLCALLFFMGAAMGSCDVTMNAHGVAVERRYGRAILASFHAAFSVGGLAGGALGALAAAGDVDVRIHLAVIAALSAAVGLTWSRRFLGADADAVAHTDPIFVRPPRRLLALGGLAFACLIIEGASADWSAVYLRDELGTTAAIAALGFTAFSVTMTLGRLFGDRLVDRFGPQTVVRAGGGLAAVGFGAGLLIAQPAAAIVGFACLGAGMSGVVPIIFRASGHVPGMAAGVGLAAASSMGYLGFLVGPPTIGGIAELTGLPTALVVLVLLAAVVALLAPTTRYAHTGAGVAREPQPVVAPPPTLVPGAQPP